MQRISRGLIPLALLAACNLSTGCSGDSSPREGDSASDGSLGSLGLALDLDPSTKLDSVQYVITGENGYSTSGDIDVSHASDIHKVIPGLPSGHYTVVLTAAAVGTTATCVGTATFVVQAHATTPVDVKLQCRLDQRTGSASIDGAVNTCPTIESFAALPLRLTVGEVAQLLATVSDADNGPQPLVYSWSATSGSFSSNSAPDATFTATEAGTSTLTLSVSDGACADSWSLDVEVQPPATGSGGTSGAGGSASGSGGSASSSGGSASGSGGSASGSGGSASGSGGSASGSGGSLAGSGGSASGSGGSGPGDTPPTLHALQLIGTSVGVRATGVTTSAPVPDGVQAGDLAVVLLLATGTGHTVSSSPTGFTTRDLAAINHRLSYGPITTAGAPLTWTLSASSTTSATAYFFRGDNASVYVAASGSSSGSNFDVAAATTAPASTGANAGFALFSIQLPLASTPTITTPPGAPWTTPPVSDGAQLFTWYAPYSWGTSVSDTFNVPGVSGSVLSASATKRTAQVVVYSPVLP